MWIESELYKEDLNSIVLDTCIDWDKLQNKKILITGATGLIGSNLVHAFLFADSKKGLGLKIYAMMRNLEKANRIFAIHIESKRDLILVKSDIKEKIEFDFDVDYIIHTASPTNSKQFIDFPVETIDTIFMGTRNILEIAKNKRASVIFLSSMEVYGTPLTDEKIYENHHNNLQTTEVRNCYPIAKRMAENLCICYGTEFDMDVKVVRLTQTFGPGVEYKDGRVFAEFTRCAIEKKDIVLKTTGETRRSYLYTADAVRGILTVMLNGEAGGVYNIANEETYCSILEMAWLVSEVCTKNRIKVVCDLSSDLSEYGYAPILHMNLSTEKIQKLGWKPYFSLEKMIRRLYHVMEDEGKNNHAQFGN